MKNSKKIIALILSAILMFSIAILPNAAVTEPEKESVSLSEYRDYLSDVLNDNDANTYVKIVARFVIIGVMIGFIDLNDFEAWLDNFTSDRVEEPETTSVIETTEYNPENTTYPSADGSEVSTTVAVTQPTASDEPTYDSDVTTEIPEDTTDWEDGTELNLHSSQSLPMYAGENNELVINDIKVTKERYNGIRFAPDGYMYDQVQKYRYHITIEGNCENIGTYGNYSEIDLQYFSTEKDGSEGRYYPFRNNSDQNIDATITVDSQGNFVYDCYQYNMFYDYNTFYVAYLESDCDDCDGSCCDDDWYDGIEEESTTEEVSDDYEGWD